MRSSEGMTRVAKIARMILAVMVAIAVFATFCTIALPYFERGDLGKRGPGPGGRNACGRRSGEHLGKRR